MTTYETLTLGAQNAAKQLVIAWNNNTLSPYFNIVLPPEKDTGSKLQTLALKGVKNHGITWDNLQELEDAELVTISYAVRGPKTVRLKRALRIMIKELRFDTPVQPTP